MKRFLSLLLVLLLLPCAALGDPFSGLAEQFNLAGEGSCAICGGDGVCDGCGGNGYQMVELFGSDDLVNIQCTYGCNGGVCPNCSDGCTLCGGDRICNTCGGAGYTLMTLHDSGEAVQIACSAGCGVGVCPHCAAECALCGSDGLCNTCGGLGYTLAQIYGDGAEVKIACMDTNCHQGFCAACMPKVEDRFALVAAAAPQSTPAPEITPTPEPTPEPVEEPTRTPKPTPTVVPEGQASFGDGTVIADPILYTGREFYLGSSDESTDPAEDADWYNFKPTTFSGSVYSLGLEYVQALVDSGNYVLHEQNDYEGSFWWILTYIGPARIDHCDDAMLHDGDVRVHVDTEDSDFSIYLNPDISFYE